MRKRFVALVICAVLVSTVAATTAVSAQVFGPTGQRGNSAIKQLDITLNGNVVGQATVNTANGHYVANAKIGKEYASRTVHLWGPWIEVLKEFIDLGSATVNNGGNAHWEGTVAGQDLGYVSGVTSLWIAF